MYLPGVSKFLHDVLHVLHHPSFRRPAEAEGVLNGDSLQTEVDLQVLELLWLR